MGKKAKKRRETDLKVDPWQDDPVTEQASVWPPSDELDPDGDVVLILNSSPSVPEQAVYRIQNEGIVRSHRRKFVSSSEITLQILA